MTELIIAEKPDAAKNIAFALADGNAKKLNIEGVPYYELTHKGKKIIVGSAVGHLYTVAAKVKSWSYPQFDTLWEETSKVDKSAAFTRKYVSALKKLSKEADEFTVATDFDIEGEVIGYNVIHHICKQKDANRMKFSTLTKPDIVEAYEEKQRSIDWGQANAGITRHELDWYYGINLSSALTSAVKAAGAFKVLSSGRVQGPALNMLCEKEREIMAFKPTPYWEIELLGKVKNSNIEAWHIESKIFEEIRADEIIKITSGKDGVVEEKKFSEQKQMPPFPFDLTSFQIECFRVHKISPKETLSIAQQLYVAGIISYPRTSSQKLPSKIGFNRIFDGLKTLPDYTALVKKLLSMGQLKPNEGPKEDDAHPAIFPTGQAPENLNSRSEKVYDLIVRRFLATFGEPAIRESVTAKILVEKECFICKGITTKFKGWHEYYGPYAIYDETILPPMEKDDNVSVKSITKLSKETKPPKRYTQASIINELDKRNLGTKATRAQIIDNLYARGYVNNKSMEVTDLGMKTCDTLQKYSPQILDENLTRQFEDELESIRKKKSTPERVLKDAKDILTKLLKEFKSKEKTIGEALKQAEYDSKDAMATIGPCPNCGKGTLKIRKGKYGLFVGCDAYPDCKTIFSIPQHAKVSPSKKICETCNHPEITVSISGKIPQDICINNECKSKRNEKEANAVDGIKVYPEEGMECPICKKGKMVLRKSFYGSFLGCNEYPRCKTMMKIIEGKVNITPITQNAKPSPVKAKSPAANVNPAYLKPSATSVVASAKKMKPAKSKVSKKKK